DEPTPTRELFVIVLNLSAATGSKICLQRTSERTIAKMDDWKQRCPQPPSIPPTLRL
ncbi:hypothetical protein K443DRAFT_657949, partial [Laccaria amethystina LaAM-08-1]